MTKYKIRKIKKKLKSGQYKYHSWEKGYHRNKIEYYDIAVNEFKTISKNNIKMVVDEMIK